MIAEGDGRVNNQSGASIKGAKKEAAWDTCGHAVGEESLE